MSKDKPTATIDPALLKELKQAKAGDRLEVVVALHPPDPKQAYVTPEQTQSIVEDLLARVGKTTGAKPLDYNIFKYLGSFVVVASPKFIRELVKQDEVASATLNRQPDGSDLSAL